MSKFILMLVCAFALTACGTMQYESSGSSGESGYQESFPELPQGVVPAGP